MPVQHLNWYVAHEPVVVALVVVGLGVVTQLVPSLFLFFVPVPGQHPNFQALHAGVVLATVVVATLGGGVAALTTGLDTAHGLALEHRFCFLRESVNPFETKSLTAEARSEALPAKVAST